MLPYHLRLPVRKKGINQKFDFYANGGEICDAILHDLRQLRVRFEAELEASSKHWEWSQRRGLPSGLAFDVMKRVSRESKIAMFHTRFAPKRCDRGAFSQLMYSVCWKMLSSSFEDYASVSMIEAAFAVFALYILYETNPLPKCGSENEKELLTMLPLGLHQNTENPGFLFRRHFKQAIRVDTFHFYCLLQLLELARAKKGMVAFEPTKTCEFASSKDVVALIPRLLPHLQLCSYTGPCGLEALAGNEEYSRTAAKSAEDDPIGSAAQKTENVEDLFSDLASELNGNLCNYLTACNAIQLPRSSDKTLLHTRVQRVRSILDPIFDSRDEDGLFERMRRVNNGYVDNAKCIKVRRVTFGMLEVPVDTVSQASASRVVQGDSHFVDSGSVATSVESEVNDGPHSMADLILPGDLSSTLEESLTDAFESLMARRRPMVLAGSMDAMSKSDVSGLGTEGVSQGAESLGTDAGRKALDTLLGRATENGQRLSRADAFLLDDSTVASQPTSKREARPDENGELSGLSSDEDELSVAASAVGRKALSRLLSLSAKSHVKRKKEKRDTSRAVRARTPRNLTPTTRHESFDEEIHDHVSISSTADSEGVGKNALMALLSMAKSNKSTKA